MVLIIVTSSRKSYDTNGCELTFSLPRTEGWSGMAQSWADIFDRICLAGLSITIDHS
jgi:hypothetical protein